MKIGEKKNIEIFGVERKMGTVGNMTFEVLQSGSFDYGNGTAVKVEYFSKSGEHTKEIFDTRYFTGSLEEFVHQYEDEELASYLHFKY